MAVSSSDVVVYGSQNMAEADNAIQGGAIDTAKRVVFTDLEANDSVKIVSTAGDTGTVTITGRGSTGAIVSETLTLNGTSSVAGSTTFQRILKIVCASHSGIITVQDVSDSTNIVEIESSVTEIRRPFYNVSADTVDGSDRAYYEKVFVKNNRTGRVQKVNFGSKTMSIKKNIPARQKSFFARFRPILAKVKGQKNLSPAYWAI